MRMLLHELKTRASKSRKRIGRGSHRGTFSGRGVKGQKSRAGGTPRPAIRDFLKKLPKRRGWKLKPGPRIRIVNVAELNGAFDGGSTVTVEGLEKKGLISSARRGKTSKAVKVLGQGDIKKQLVITAGIRLSASARAKIEEAGGKIESDE